MTAKHIKHTWRRNRDEDESLRVFVRRMAKTDPRFVDWMKRKGMRG